MKELLKKYYRRFFKKAWQNKIKPFINTKLYFVKKKQCYICNKKFHHFSKHVNIRPKEFGKIIQMVGTDPKNFKCYYCGCNDRIRHLFMFFDKLSLWSKFENARILHFAPEKEISNKIKSLKPANYIMADLFPKNEECRKIDLTDIPFDDNSMDIILCNHVLEHVVDYKKALSEIKRVLSKNGFAILQTPYSLLLNKNFEDDSIDNEYLRTYFYKQYDHVRIFSKKQLFQDIEAAGLELNIVKNTEIFDDNETYYYGVNKLEDLIKVIKK